MEKLTILFVLLLSMLLCQSQNLVQEGKLWSNVEIGTISGSPYRGDFIKFSGDSTINGQVYKKILKSTNEFHSKWAYEGLIKEELETGKVFIFNKYTNKDILIYDFSLEEGDSIFVDEQMPYIKIKKVVYAPFGSSPEVRKQIYFDINGNTRWIEGIGSTWGILNGLNSFYTTGADYYLVCYFENDQLIYHNPQFINCYAQGLSNFGQFTIDLGNDTTYCADGNTSSIPMGIKVNFKNGVEPYTYAWECKIVPYGYQKPQSASDVLSDSTLMSPTLINSVWLYAADKTKFILHVTDHAGNTAKDSIYVSFSAWGSTLGYQVIELAQGDSIFLNAGTPGGRVANFYWTPFEGLSTPNNPSTWVKPTVSTDYYSVLVDTSGCVVSNHSYQIIIIPTGSESLQSNAESTIKPIQKGSKVYFSNKNNQEALVSVFTLDGKLIHQCATTSESYDISQDIGKNDIYLIKIALEGKVGVCKYYRY